MSTVPGLVFDKSVRAKKSARLRSIISSVVVTSLTVGLTVAVPKSVAASASGEGGAGSVAVGMAGGAGNVDERTGLMSFQNQLGVLPGAGAAQVDLGVTYAQSQAGQDDGLGGGMSWGLPHLRGGDTLVLADGRDFHLDPTAWSGLGDYALANLKLTRFTTALPAGAPGCAATRPCAYALTDSSGVREVFDIDGLLGARTDHFGNTARFDFDTAHRLVAVHGGYPDAPVTATVQYSGSSDVTINFPTTTDGLTPHAHLHFANNLLDSVTDTAGNQLDLTWAPHRVGGVDTPLLTSTLTSTGARMQITYRQYDPGVWAVDRIETLDAATGRPLTAPLQFNLNPDGNPESHNYTGYPRYHTTVPGPDAKTTDPLVASNDKDYHYLTSVSDGNVTTYRQFDHLHRKTAEWSTAHLQGQERTLSNTTMDYPDQDASWPNVPATYQLPTTTTNTTIDPINPTITRTATITSNYDTLGRETERTTNGITTTTTYDTALTEQPDTATNTTDVAATDDAATDDAAADDAAADVDPGRGYGLVLSTRTTVLDGDQAGTTVTTTNDLTADRGAVATATTTMTDPTTGQATTSQVQHTEYTATGEPARTDTTGYSTDGTPTSTTQTFDYTVENGLRKLTVTDGTGSSSSMVFDNASGKQVQSIDPAGLVTTTTYDEYGRLASVTDPVGITTHTHYEDAGIGGSGINETTTVRDGDGYATRQVRDAANRVVQVADNQSPAGQLNIAAADVSSAAAGGTAGWRTLGSTTFNELGQQESTTDRAGLTTHYQYDIFGQVETVTNPDGTSAHTMYAPATGTETSTLYVPGRPDPVTTTVTKTDLGGRVTTQSTTYGDGTPGGHTEIGYNGLGQQAELRDHGSGEVLTNDYSPVGDLIGSQISGSEQQVSASYTLDGLGHTLAKTLDVEGNGTAQSELSSYDAAGRQITQTDGSGAVTANTYDQAGRLVAITYPDQRVKHTAYDPHTGRIATTWWTVNGSDQHLEEAAFDYDPVTGQVAAVWFTADPDSSRINYTYLPDGSPLAVTYADGSTLSYTYDTAGNIETVTDPDGTITRYTYDEQTGRLGSVAQPNARADYHYDAAGALAQIDRSNPATGATVGSSSYTHNDAGLILSEKHTDAQGALVEAHQYTWNVKGLLVSDTTTLGDSVPTPTDGPLTDLRTTTTVYGYDPSDRLVDSTIHAGTDTDAPVISRTTYTLNAASDVTSMTTTAGDQVTTVEYSIDEGGRQASITTNGATVQQEWDGMGNLLRAADGTTYTYSASGQPTSWTLADGSVTTLTWRADGTRDTKTTPTGDRIITFASPGSAATVLTERSITPTGQTTSYSSLYGHGREAHTATDPTGSPDTDWLISNRRGDVTSVQDTTGTVVSHATYTDYGVPTITSTAPTGHQPYGYAGGYTDNGTGGSGLQWNSLRHYNPTTAAFTSKDPTPLLNRYTYAAGNPINYTDPTGRMPQWLNLAINGAAALSGLVGIAGGPIGIGLALLSSAIALTVVINETLGFANKPHMPDNVAQALSYTALGLGLLSMGWSIGTAYTAKSAVTAAKTIVPDAEVSPTLLAQIEHVPAPQNLNVVDDLAVKNAVAPLEERTSSLSTALQDARNKLQAAKQEAQLLDDQHFELDLEVSRHAQRAIHLNGEIEQAGRELQAATNEATRLSSSIENLQAEVAGLTQGKRQLTEQLSAEMEKAVLKKWEKEQATITMTQASFRNQGVNKTREEVAQGLSKHRMMTRQTPQ
jgi:RHS repeat-associated protein